jgi:hypothetical protein
MTGYDSRAGTIVHEMAHLFGCAYDHWYGLALSGILPFSDPVRATENADNYAYMSEDLLR